MLLNVFAVIFGGALGSLARYLISEFFFKSGKFLVAGFSKFLFDHRRDAFCYGLIEQSFDAFISLYLKRYTEAPVFHFTGSVAFYYSDILKQVMKKNGLPVGHISEGPMAGLCLYHKGEFWP